MSGRCDTCSEVGYVWCGDCLGPHPEDAVATREKLRSENERLRKALAPFARAYWQRHPGQDDRPIMTVWDEQQNEFVLTAGNFHRAADALGAKPEV